MAMFHTGEMRMSHNRTFRCGYKQGSPSDHGVGLSAGGLQATVLIDACQAIDIGEPAKPGGAPFMGIRYGILAAASRVRVHDCTIVSPSLATETGGPGANQNSRALQVMALGSGADVTDNLVEQTAATIVFVIGTDTIFSNNRCTHLDLGHSAGPVVSVAGTHVIVTGNRIRANGASPSLGLIASQALTAVANIVSGGESIAMGSAMPVPPYASSNVNA
jgi:hypothetical protein